jgi:hypothetical protein
MKIRHLIIFSLLFLISCKNETKTLNIVLTKNEKKDSASIRFNSLSISNSDSIYYKANNLDNFKFQDTIKIDKLPIGNYKLEYFDLLGNLITKKISLNKNIELKIVADSIDIRNFENKTAIINLKKDAFYTLKMKGGDVATYYGYYKINRIKDQYFIESYDIKKRLINQVEFNQIKKFESELLAINEKKYFSSTASKTFEIITDSTKIITDNTYNWNGWSNLFRNLKK